MNKLFILPLAAAGLFLMPTSQADAHTTVAPVTQSGPTVLPGVAHMNPVVVVNRYGNRHRRYNRRYRTRRTVVYTNGRRRTVVRRVYY